MSGFPLTYIITHRHGVPIARIKLLQYAAVTKIGMNRFHAASRRQFVGWRDWLRYATIQARSSMKTKSQSGRQDTDGRSTSQSDGDVCPGADRWGESSEKKCL
jgi:hypothetical protein